MPNTRPLHPKCKCISILAVAFFLASRMAWAGATDSIQFRASDLGVVGAPDAPGFVTAIGNKGVVAVNYRKRVDGYSYIIPAKSEGGILAPLQLPQPEDFRGTANAINSNGVIAGRGDAGAGFVYRWQEDHVDFSDGPANAYYIEVAAINANGTIAGSTIFLDAVTKELSGRATVWFANKPYYVIDQTLRSNHNVASAKGINTYNSVVGKSFENGAWGGTRAFLWTPLGGMSELGMIRGGLKDEIYIYSEAFYINDAGLAVGASRTPEGQIHATLWDTQTGAITDLQVTGELAASPRGKAFIQSHSIPLAGNEWMRQEFGPFVGGKKYAMQKTQTLLEQLTRESKLKPDGEALQTTIIARHINNKAQIVGEGSSYYLDKSGNTQFYPFAAYWPTKDAGPVDLNTFLTQEQIDAGWSLQWAAGINDAGVIAGTAINSKTNKLHGYTLSPILPSEVVAGDITPVLTLLLLD